MQILPCLGSPSKHSSTSQHSKFGSFHPGAPAEHLAWVGYRQDIKLNDLPWFPGDSWILHSPGVSVSRPNDPEATQCPQSVNAQLPALGAMWLC